MTVNQLINKLRTLQRQGHGTVDVHMIAHDNSPGETQGEVAYVTYYKKKAADREAADISLFDITPEEIVYVQS